MGGTFKCGGCGCKETLMDDQAHTLSAKQGNYMSYNR